MKTANTIYTKLSKLFTNNRQTVENKPVTVRRTYQVGCTDCGTFYDTRRHSCPACASRAQFQHMTALTLRAGRL